MHRAAGGSNRLGDFSVDGGGGVVGCPDDIGGQMGQMDDGLESAVVGVTGAVRDLHGDGTVFRRLSRSLPNYFAFFLCAAS